MKICMAVMNDVVYDQRVIKEARTLVRAGNEVTIIGLLSSNTQPREIRDGITIVRIQPFQFSKNPYRQLLDIFLYYKPIFFYGTETQKRMFDALNAVQADVYHAHDLDTLAVCAMAAQRHKAKLIYDSHEYFLGKIGVDYPNMVLRGFYKSWLLWHYRRVESKYIKRAAHVITVSPPIAELLSKAYSINQPTVLLNVPNLTPLNNTMNLRKILGIPDGAAIVLYQGTAHKSMALEETIESMSFLPSDYFLVMYLACSTERRDELLAATKKLGLEKRVLIEKPVPFDMFPLLNPSASVGVIPLRTHIESYRLALPNKLFQYAMAGLPVAATALPVMSELIKKHGIGKVFESVDPHAIALTITEIYTSRGYQIMRQRSRSVAETYYNWEIEERKLIAIYETLRQG